MASEGFSNLRNSIILQFQPMTGTIGAASKHQRRDGLGPGQGVLSKLWNSGLSKEKLQEGSLLSRIPSSSSSPSLISQEATKQLSLPQKPLRFEPWSPQTPKHLHTPSVSPRKRPELTSGLSPKITKPSWLYSSLDQPNYGIYSK